MPRPIGSRQARALSAVADPRLAAIAPSGDHWLSVCRRGLVEQVPDKPGCFRITPAGLRALADWLEVERS